MLGLSVVAGQCVRSTGRGEAAGMGPLLAKFSSRTQAASAKWAEYHKTEIDDELRLQGSDQRNIGARQAVRAKLFKKLDSAMQAAWAAKARERPKEEDASVNWER